MRKNIEDRKNDKKDFSQSLIVGKNAVIELLRSNRDVNKILIYNGSKESSIKKIIEMAKENRIVIQFVDKNTLSKYVDFKLSQGVIAFAALKNYVDIDDIIERAYLKNEKPFLLILDGITDVNNFGAIIRTAECLGVHGIIIPKRRSVSVNTAISKVSAGAIEYLDIARVTNIPNMIDTLKEKGIWIFGTDVGNGSKFYENDYNIPMALVVGNEGKGISSLVEKKCDYIINIPMKGKISSLNVSVASGIIMYEVFKKRDMM